MERILNVSGTGEATHWPPGSTRLLTGADKPDESIEAARDEAKTVIFGCLDELFEKTKIDPRRVSIPAA